MANKENISFLSKYQMKVLYYKCKEGATHEEIAEILGRDVNTVQYHMTKIYKILEITGPDKSKEEMDSELKNEICPFIRERFQTFDDVKTWAPSIRKTPDEEKEEPVPPYQTPPSLEAVLKQAESQPLSPEILEPPPPGRVRILWMRITIWLIIVGVIIAAGLIFSRIYHSGQVPIETPTQLILAPPLPALESPVFQTSMPAATLTLVPIPTVTQTTAPTPTVMSTEISPIDGMVLIPVPAGEFEMGSSKAEDSAAQDEETPQHIVYLDDYWIDQTEVTNAQYARCGSLEIVQSQEKMAR